MKTFCSFVLLLAVLTSCSGDDINADDNPNLVNLNVNVQYNLTLPQYNDLNFEGNSFQDYSAGISGITTYYIGNDQYLAFELTDPNHPVSNCSALVVNGITARCQCDDNNEYSIINGQQTSGAQGQYTLRMYRASLSGDILSITN